MSFAMRFLGKHHWSLKRVNRKMSIGEFNSNVCQQHARLVSSGVPLEVTMLSKSYHKGLFCLSSRAIEHHFSFGKCWQEMEISHGNKSFHSDRCPTLLAGIDGLHNILAYIKSTSEPEGPNHCWFNQNSTSAPYFDEKEIFLVLVGAFLHNPTTMHCRNHTVLLERTKMLQSMHPSLRVFGFQYCKLPCPVSSQALVAMTLMKCYVQFPVLLSNNVVFEETMLPEEVCLALFIGTKGLVFKYSPDVDIEVISAEIDKHKVISLSNPFHTEVTQNSDMKGLEVSTWHNFCSSFKNFLLRFPEMDKHEGLSFSNPNHPKDTKNIGVRDFEVVKGNIFCSSFKNLLLNNPGCLSTDEHRDRLFISDTNHHRIIISNGHGRIVDCIGSIPGFVDSRFESAQLMCPAGSIYDAVEDCLYFADCENHSIRRAHMTTRVVETLYPACSHKTTGIRHWILNTLGVASESYNDLADLTLDSFAFPWHLLKAGENDLLVLTRSFETSWILCKRTGQIGNVLKGFLNIMNAYEKIIMNKALVVKELCKSHVLPIPNPDSSLEVFPYINLISSIAKLQNCIFYCDEASQRVLKCDLACTKYTHVNFSNLELLGLPYWIVTPVERVLLRNGKKGFRMDNIKSFKTLPGTSNILITVNVPNDFELGATLNEECIWRETRGAATDITGIGDDESSYKVGIAQQWYDELDNLIYTKPDSGSFLQSQEVHPDLRPTDEKNVQIKCSINTSPGTSEIFIMAALYLKPRSSLSNHEIKSKLLNLSKTSAAFGGIDLMLETIQDLTGLVFIKPLYLRIKLECADHPTDPVTREIISTTTNLDVSVFL